MNPLRSVGAQLSLALAVLVAGSLGVVYLFVVPSLERNLINAKLSQLERVAPDIRRQLGRDRLGINDPDFVGNASDDANARVVIFGTLAPSPPTLQAIADSRQGTSSRSSTRSRVRAGGRSTSSWTGPPGCSATTSGRFGLDGRSSRTRFGTRRRGRRSSSGPVAASGRCSRSQTTGPASLRPSSGRSSSASTAGTARSP